MDPVFRALAAPSRRQLLDRLQARNGQTLTQLCRELRMTRQAVTKHLNLLLKADLVVALWRGRKKLHYINPAPLIQISHRWLRKFEEHRLQALDDLERALRDDQLKER